MILNIAQNVLKYEKLHEILQRMPRSAHQENPIGKLLARTTQSHRNTRIRKHKGADRWSIINLINLINRSFGTVAARTKQKSKEYRSFYRHCHIICEILPGSPLLVCDLRRKKNINTGGQGSKARENFSTPQYFIVFPFLLFLSAVSRLVPVPSPVFPLFPIANPFDQSTPSTLCRVNLFVPSSTARTDGTFESAISTNLL